MGNGLNAHIVTVHRPHGLGEEEIDRLQSLLGVEPLTAATVTSPWITLDERVHSAASRWLHLRTRQSRSTLEANARDVAAYIEFLVNERNLWHSDEAFSDVFAVTYDDLLGFQRRVMDAGALPSSWNRINSSVKQFHEFCQIEFRLPPPWIPRKVWREGRPVTSNMLSLRAKRGTAGTPLHPDFVDVLLQAALRLDKIWNDRSVQMARRDLSFISHALATGMRNTSLRWATVYEVPPVSNSRHGWNQVRVPDATAKGLAGGVALSFEHRLETVRDYINGSRKEQVEASVRFHRPERSLRIVEADLTGWKAIDVISGEVRSRSWADSDDGIRGRLVEEDGSSPVIHLSAHGRPMTKQTASSIVRDARRFAQQHIEPAFPAIHLHDLRHTYAVHLAVCIFHGRVAQAIEGPASRAWRDRTVADAVAAVQASLGHASSQTTSTYITYTTQHILSGTPPERYLGV